MEDGAKEDPALKKEPKFLSKAGWLKKGYGRLLASYKDRYIQVEKTEIVVYENEDLQNCLERLDLENYDKCHELKSPFTKKQRLILIRSAKSTNKVREESAQTVEDKEAWIKALSDGINRAKNKIFDEVKIDQSSNLEHVTRTRPKGNRNRRPPTRIHMKESTTETLTLSPLLYHLSGEKKKQDEKSVDSGQHSDDGSEGSGSQDTLVAATAALRGSHSALDVVDASEDSIQISVILRPAQVTTVPQVSSKNIKPIPPLKPSAKGRSASIGNLLSESDVCNQMKESSRGGAVSAGGSSDDVIKLETEVALEMEKTSKLLSKVSQDHGSEEEDVPGDLLAEAMEKLKKADHVLREVKKLKCATNGSKRKSW
ncbi:pleckstrin homology domain-containing family O member 2 [Neolamprologus brichardi]|uniref:pleckstrin homology domain-containing family O member 2 n=1 Tax=Neolamprologus brichardi TaxID=32507 RepID=UPI001643C02E|nr:pleckstrin homology domain-containing family O member 2 [Neolamprologus brichardi]